MAVERTDLTVIRNVEDIEYFDETYEKDGVTKTFKNSVVGDKVFQVTRKCYKEDEEGKRTPTRTVVGYNFKHVKDE